jgi:hypothetical protein
MTNQHVNRKNLKNIVKQKFNKVLFSYIKIKTKLIISYHMVTSSKPVIRRLGLVGKGKKIVGGGIISILMAGLQALYKTDDRIYIDTSQKHSLLPSHTCNGDVGSSFIFSKLMGKVQLEQVINLT